MLDEWTAWQEYMRYIMSTITTTDVVMVDVDDTTDQNQVQTISGSV